MLMQAYGLDRPIVWPASHVHLIKNIAKEGINCLITYSFYSCNCQDMGFFFFAEMRWLLFTYCIVFGNGFLLQDDHATHAKKQLAHHHSFSKSQEQGQQ